MKPVIVSTIAMFLVLLGETHSAPQSNLNGLNKKASINIVGGQPAKQGEAPYQLSLLYFNRLICGASLVEVDGLQFALTAAHCVEYRRPREFQVVAGDVNLDDKTGLEQRQQVERILVHENYTRINIQNDIAILLLNSSFQLNNNTKTVPLPTQGQETTAGNLTVSGWGRLAYNRPTSRDLQIVKIPLVNDTACRVAYKNVIQITDSMICAGTPAGDVSACNGDSGGPAISDTGYLAGIVSFGHYTCAHPEYPSVYTEVSHYIDWIHETLRNVKNNF